MNGVSKALQIKNLRHMYQDESGSHRFLLHVAHLHIPIGSWTSILGPSGCGKSTLENNLGLIRSPSCGDGPSVDSFILNERVAGNPDKFISHDIVKLLEAGKSGRKQIEDLRRRLMGFYLQSGELIPTLTIKENVSMPLRLNGWTQKEADERVDEVLSYLLNTTPREIPNKLASKLSGGQYQRVALARAIAHKPQILFVDEPTSSLDPPNARRALDLLATLIEVEGTTVVMVTHNEELALEYSNYLIRMDSPVGGWGDQIPLSFRDGDGWGTPSRFECKQKSGWNSTDSQWLPVGDDEGEMQDAA